MVAERLLQLLALSHWENLEGSFPYQFHLLVFLAQFIALTLKALETFEAWSLFNESNSNNLPC